MPRSSLFVFVAFCRSALCRSQRTLGRTRPSSEPGASVDHRLYRVHHIVTGGDRFMAFVAPLERRGDSLSAAFRNLDHGGVPESSVPLRGHARPSPDDAEPAIPKCTRMARSKVRMAAQSTRSLMRSRCAAPATLTISPPRPEIVGRPKEHNSKLLIDKRRRAPSRAGNCHERSPASSGPRYSSGSSILPMPLQCVTPSWLTIV